MKPISKICKVAKEHGFVVKKKTYSFGESWAIHHADSNNPVGNVFFSDETPKRLQAFRAAVAAALSPEDWAELPKRLINEIKEASV